MKILNLVLPTVLLLSLHFGSYTSSRILRGELDGKLALQSLQRGPVPPSGASGCTHIPGKPGPSCPTNLVNEIHYAANALPRASAYTPLMIPFNVASNQT
ncbi:hypothetical protein Tsubulata_034549 [Turnera subulata]|uniref:Uncharacterized protein n=1 Tax=Turnera subulata TaxID=218843 RepID=A0A9Q0FI79_9ROSI|nr:hypothetical protein Tsubulata_034549 [Turnera subulata]